ncbi:MAG: agmatinase [Eubacteriales bacterium]|nr:agmatinase [Eubacteriales bacterium]
MPDFPVLSLRLMDCSADYEKARIVLFGAPFDGTVSFRPGSRFGPQAMRQDAIGLEGYSPYQDREIDTSVILDIGDLDLPMGDKIQALRMIRETVATLVTDGKFPLMLGGEHLVTLGVIEALVKKHPDLCIVHLDAHTDLRQDYLGVELSHATVMRRIWDILGDGRIFQLGIRSGTTEEFVFAREGHTTLYPFTLGHLDEIKTQINGRPVFLTIDLDVLDPSVFSGTGTPEPGGVDFLTTMRFLVDAATLNLVGADLVELAPHYDPSGVSTAVALKLLRELIIAYQQSNHE